MRNVELICNDNNLCGEGPLWDPKRKRLIWNDCSSSLLFEYAPEDGSKRVISRGLMISGAALNRKGGLVVCGTEGLQLWKEQDQFRTIVREHEGQRLCFNDIIADSSGGIFAGTLYWEGTSMAQPGKLYHIAANANVRIVDEGIQLANGLGFSPGNRQLYFADTAARTIYAYELDGSQLRNKRVFVRVGDDEGVPDGLTVDAEGFVYSAQWYGGQVVRYDPDGKVHSRIAMPVRQVSSVAFGGDDLCDLYITTAGESGPDQLAPAGYDFSATNVGGALYRVRVDVPGKLEHLADFALQGAQTV